MTQILHIQSSPNLQGSASRALSNKFIAEYRDNHPGTTVLERDLAIASVPHLGVDLLGGMFAKPELLTPAQQDAVALSDTLVDELLASDILVLGVPMYNFGLPSNLKAWIDHVVRSGKTFKYGETGPQGLVTGKKAYVFMAAGGNYSQPPMNGMDFVEPYLKAILGFMGITDITFIRAEGLAMGPEAAEKAKTEASSKAERLAA
jgi:FMN-dependent NADH-azoreductase